MSWRPANGWMPSTVKKPRSRNPSPRCVPASRSRSTASRNSVTSPPRRNTSPPSPSRNPPPTRPTSTPSWRRPGANSSAPSPALPRSTACARTSTISTRGSPPCPRIHPRPSISGARFNIRKTAPKIPSSSAPASSPKRPRTCASSPAANAPSTNGKRREGKRLRRGREA